MAGLRLRADGIQEPVSVNRWQSLSAALTKLPGDDFYARWAQWFLVDRMRPHPAELVR